MKKMYNLFSLIFMISLGFSWANATNLVPDTCKKISDSDPSNIKYDFCVAALGSDPRSPTASLDELGVISFELDISKAKSISSTIENLLQDPNLDPSVKSALKDCLELYSDDPNDLEEGLNALKDKDYPTANIKASAAMDSATTCEDGFNENQNEGSPLTKENADFFQLTAISLAFTNLLK